MSQLPLGEGPAVSKAVSRSSPWAWRQGIKASPGAALPPRRAGREVRKEVFYSWGQGGKTPGCVWLQLFWARGAEAAPGGGPEPSALGAPSNAFSIPFSGGGCWRGKHLSQTLFLPPWVKRWQPREESEPGDHLAQGCCSRHGTSGPPGHLLQGPLKGATLPPTAASFPSSQTGDQELPVLAKM